LQLAPGGGDWAKDRIVPDCIRHLQRNEAIPVRNPKATRPWQHVLEPLSGYLWLAAWLSKAAQDNTQIASAFNFGPGHEANRTVEELASEVLKHWPGRWENRSNPQAVHEANLLQLSTDKASAILGWRPVWDFPTTIKETVQWYRDTASAPQAAQSLTSRQVADYQSAAREIGITWAS
jgi:CDP-glucose 4,6-dehydratase